MSRKGKVPIPVPKGVEVTMSGNRVQVKGPKGTLAQEVADGIIVDCDGNVVRVSTKDDTRRLKSFHGLYWALIQNMLIGVSAGFEKKLELIGVGYRAEVKDGKLKLSLGFSHPCELPVPQGLSAAVEKLTAIIISGSDKQAVGQFAALIRSKRPPEPYKGKGVRYANEQVRRKAGKSAKK